MERLKLVWALASVVMLPACKATTKLPLETEHIELRIETDQLVCHVREISNAQGLSFHYGIDYSRPGGLAAFRLIGDELEIVLVAQRRFDYILDVYEMSTNGSARVPAARAYSTFKEALLNPPSGECTS